MKLFLLDHEAYKECFEEELTKIGKRREVDITWKDFGVTSVTTELPKLVQLYDAYFLHIIGKDEFKLVVDFKKRFPESKMFLRANLGPTFNYTSFPEGIKRFGGERDVSRYLNELLQSGEPKK